MLTQGCGGRCPGKIPRGSLSEALANVSALSAPFELQPKNGGGGGVLRAAICKGAAGNEDTKLRGGVCSEWAKLSLAGEGARSSSASEADTLYSLDAEKTSHARH